MTYKSKQELDRVAYAIHTKRKKKGAGKGYKNTYTKVWSGAMTMREYLTYWAEFDPKGCGLWLCYVEHREWMEDRWWDYPEGRDKNIRGYRDRIKDIRQKYGLSKSEVSEFMRVD